MWLQTSWDARSYAEANGSGTKPRTRKADHVLAYVRKAFNWQATRDDDFKSPIVNSMVRISCG